MKVTIKRIKQVSLEDFCTTHGLVVHIEELALTNDTVRYRAQFGPFLVRTSGSAVAVNATGESERAAVDALVDTISGKCIFIETALVRVPLLSKVFTLELSEDA